MHEIPLLYKIVNDLVNVHKIYNSKISIICMLSTFFFIYHPSVFISLKLFKNV